MSSFAKVDGVASGDPDEHKRSLEHVGAHHLQAQPQEPQTTHVRVVPTNATEAKVAVTFVRLNDKNGVGEKDVRRHLAVSRERVKKLTMDLPFLAMRQVPRDEWVRMGVVATETRGQPWPWIALGRRPAETG